MFQSSFEQIWETLDKNHVILITDENIFRYYKPLFKDHKTLLVNPGEGAKEISTIERLSKELVSLEATRKTILVGVGGGVITDITGFLASVYMRGISFGFVPTTLLGMVDAAAGGKNGVNLGFNKNMLGTINQPDFILYDTSFLSTLSDDEWSNGFAEIIKYACIFDEALYQELHKNSITFYKTDGEALEKLIERCVDWKNKTVMEDEHEKGERKLLNFGHTAAHAIEQLYELPHGKAVGIGMIIATMISVSVTGLEKSVTEDIKRLLSLYHLPVKFKFDPKRAMELLRMDKKRNEQLMDYILLDKPGKASLHSLPFEVIENALNAYESEN